MHSATLFLADPSVMSQVGTKEHVLKAAWQNRPVVELHCYPVSGRGRKGMKKWRMKKN
jgi:hypothetical protein